MTDIEEIDCKDFKSEYQGLFEKITEVYPANYKDEVFCDLIFSEEAVNILSSLENKEEIPEGYDIFALEELENTGLVRNDQGEYKMQELGEIYLESIEEGVNTVEDEEAGEKNYVRINNNGKSLSEPSWYVPVSKLDSITCCPDWIMRKS